MTTQTADDYGQTLSDAGTLTAGNTVSGSIEISGDRDWFGAYLEGGRTYRINLEGVDGNMSSLSDPKFYAIYDASGEAIDNTSNDDGGEGRNSRLDFKPAVDGMYYLEAGGYSSRTGSYNLSLADVTSEFNRITFSEYNTGTVNPVFSFFDNTVSVIGEIVSDSAQPNSPAVAARSDYIGPVYVNFANPVKSVSFDAGYFNSTGSTTIQYIGAGGNILHSETNAGLGVISYSYENDAYISAIHVVNTGYDESGFSVDSISFDDSQAVQQITSEFSLASAQVSLSEGDSGTTAFEFTVTRSGDLTDAASVRWAVTPSGQESARAADFVNNDYPSGLVEFAAGEAQKQFTVAVAGDTDNEENESFSVNLITPSAGAGLTAAASQSVTILNDDADLPDIAVPDAEDNINIILDASFANLTLVDNGMEARVFDATGDHVVTLGDGVSAQLIGLSGNNEVKLDGNADAWYAGVNGSTATIFDQDGDYLQLAASLTTQTITFNDQSLDFQIQITGTPGVYLGDTLLTGNMAAIV